MENSTGVCYFSKSSDEDDDEMGEEEAVAEENGGIKVDSGVQTSSWPTMRFDISPYRTHHFSKQFRTSRNPNNFLKGLKWYPFLLVSLSSLGFCSFSKFDFFSSQLLRY